MGGLEFAREAAILQSFAPEYKASRTPLKSCGHDPYCEV
jgi:hypothetical protein